MSRRPTVAVVSFSELARDPRVRRQIRFLSEAYRVIAVGYSDPGVNGVEFRPIRAEMAGAKTRRLPPPFNALRTALYGRPMRYLRALLKTAELRSGLYERIYWRDPRVVRCGDALMDIDAQVFVSNDIDTLPVVLRAARGAPVLYDAHEYASREYEESLRWRFMWQGYFRYLCRRYVPRASRVTVVCEPFVREFDREFGVRSVVLTNATAYQALEPRPCGPGRIRLIYHGGAAPSRRLDNLVETMKLLDDRFSLDLMLVGDPGYVDSLRRRACGDPRIRVIPPVAMTEIVRFANEYDIGVHLLPAISFNNTHALPNKFFEYIQSRLALAIGPSPEMARYVRQYGCGVVAPEFTAASMAEALRRLSPAQVTEMKYRSHVAAGELTEERNREVFMGIVADLAAQATSSRS